MSVSSTVFSIRLQYLHGFLCLLFVSLIDTRLKTQKFPVMSVHNAEGTDRPEITLAKASYNWEK